MEQLTGTSLPVFIGVTLVLFGGASVMTGHAVADTWRPSWHVVMYGVLLGVADRLMGNLLFGGQLLSLGGYLIDTAILVLLGFFAYRVTRAHKMTRQYPWLYERTGLFGWQDKPR